MKNKVKYSKLLARIDFRPTLSSYKGIFDLARLYEKDFDEWLINKENNQVNLFSPKSKAALQIAYDSLVYINESLDAQAEFQAYFDKLLSKYKDELSIELIKRVGFRTVRVIECDFKFDELADLLYRKLFSSPEEITSVVGDKVRDLNYVIDGSKGGLLNHIQIGPLRKEEEEKYFSPQFEFKSKESESSVYMDMDVFATQELDPSNMLTRLMDCSKSNNDIYKSYCDYIFS